MYYIPVKVSACCEIQRIKFTLIIDLLHCSFVLFHISSATSFLLLPGLILCRAVLIKKQDQIQTKRMKIYETHQKKLIIPNSKVNDSTDC